MQYYIYSIITNSELTESSVFNCLIVGVKIFLASVYGITSIVRENNYIKKKYIYFHTLFFPPNGF